MPKCTIKKENTTTILKRMSDMSPLQIGYIQDSSHGDNGNLVMRTASTDNFEVINLTKFRVDRCYSNNNNSTQIKLLTKPITLTIEN